jgi:Fur family peroxide stress response transcriptional regulator
MITNKLKSSGLRQTYQRAKILEFLTKTKSHPTAFEIYKKIARDIPTVSKTTVYNNVNTLVREGIIKCIKIKEHEMRFDACTAPHYHFACDKCGKVYDIGQCCSEVLKSEMEGHEIKEVFVCFSGICRSCRQITQINKKLEKRFIKTDNIKTNSLLEVFMEKWKCNACGYVYDPAAGDPDSAIAPGTAFEDIAQDWVCPICGAGKDAFERE